MYRLSDGTRGDNGGQLGASGFGSVEVAPAVDLGTFDLDLGAMAIYAPKSRALEGPYKEREPSLYL